MVFSTIGSAPAVRSGGALTRGAQRMHRRVVKGGCYCLACTLRGKVCACFGCSDCKHGH